MDKIRVWPTFMALTLIFNIVNHAFGNNIYAGNFVIMICNKLQLWYSVGSTEMERLSIEDLNSLFIKDNENKDIIFIYEGVYTKNINFRVYQSTKFGKSSPLVTADENKYSPKIQLSILSFTSENVLPKCPPKLIWEDVLPNLGGQWQPWLLEHVIVKRKSSNGNAILGEIN